MQKACHFLQVLAGVPLDFDFILYRHGPFSFDLRDELTELRAVSYLSLEARPMSYGLRDGEGEERDLAASLHGANPHISEDEALEAVRAVGEWQEEFSKLAS